MGRKNTQPHLTLIFLAIAFCTWVIEASAQTIQAESFRNPARTGTYNLPSITGSDAILTTSATQVVRNKDYDGGTAANDRRLTIPKNTTTNLNALTRKQGTIFYDTTTNKVKVDTGSTLEEVTTTSTVSAPTVVEYTSGSGTFTLPTGATHIHVKGVAGGGGGGGSAAASAGDGGTGSTGQNTTFGTSLLTANGGVGGSGSNGGSGGTGGSVTVNSPAVKLFDTSQGGSGSAANSLSSAGFFQVGGAGAPSCIGGAGGGGALATVGNSAIANTGSGGGGGGSPSAGTGGSGGGAGGCFEAMIVGTDLASSYSWAVGSGGGGGVAGTGGQNGGSGGSGKLTITVYYDK